MAQFLHIVKCFNCSLLALFFVAEFIYLHIASRIMSTFSSFEV